MSDVIRSGDEGGILAEAERYLDDKTVWFPPIKQRQLVCDLMAALRLSQQAQEALRKERDEARGDAAHGWSEVEHQRVHKEEYARMLNAAESKLSQVQQIAEEMQRCAESYESQAEGRNAEDFEFLMDLSELVQGWANQLLALTRGDGQ